MFQDLHLVANARDSGYPAGLTVRSHYVPELQRPFTEPLLLERGCLVIHTGQPLSWPDGHGRLHGEGLIQDLAKWVQDRRDPFAQAFQVIASVPLPDGHEVRVYRRDREANLDERAAWADRLARWMPLAGVWAQFWRDTGSELHTAGRKAEACTNLQRAAEARPLRGLAHCERVDPGLCLDAVVPARQARDQMGAAQCQPTPSPWPAGIPAWVLQAQLPRPPPGTPLQP